MKGILIIFITFAIAIFSSCLLDFHFFNDNIIRKLLVIFLIVIELIIGFMIAKTYYMKR